MANLIDAFMSGPLASNAINQTVDAIKTIASNLEYITARLDAIECRLTQIEESLFAEQVNINIDPVMLRSVCND